MSVTKALKCTVLSMEHGTETQTDRQTDDYLNIYRTDLYEICKIGRTTAVYERSEVSFWTSRGTLPWQPIFVGFIGLYPHTWVRVAFARWRRVTKVQLLRWTQADQVTDQLTVTLTGGLGDTWRVTDRLSLRCV